MAKELVAVKTTKEQLKLINRGEATLREGDVILVPKGAPIGDTAAAIKRQQAAIIAGGFVPAIKYVAAALKREGRTDIPLAFELAKLRNRAEFFTTGEVPVVKSQTGVLYADTRSLQLVSFVETPILFEGQFIALRVKESVPCYSTYGLFAQLWEKSHGKWVNKKSISEGDTLKLQPTRVATFEVVDLKISPAENAQLVKLANTLFSR